MQEDQKVVQLLTKLAADHEAQNCYLRKQLFFTRIFASACCVLTIVLLAVMLRVMPPLLETMDKAVTALDQTAETLVLVDHTLTDIQTLFEADGLVGQSSEALAQATEKISQLDIESLNLAIRNLGDVVEPLANFFDKFKR